MATLKGIYTKSGKQFHLVDDGGHKLIKPAVPGKTKEVVHSFPGQSGQDAHKSLISKGYHPVRMAEDCEYSEFTETFMTAVASELMEASDNSDYDAIRKIHTATGKYGIQGKDVTMLSGGRVVAYNHRTGTYHSINKKGEVGTHPTSDAAFDAIKEGTDASGTVLEENTTRRTNERSRKIHQRIIDDLITKKPVKPELKAKAKHYARSALMVREDTVEEGFIDAAKNAAVIAATVGAAALPLHAHDKANPQNEKGFQQSVKTADMIKGKQEKK